MGTHVRSSIYNTVTPSLSTFKLLINPLYYFVTNIHVIDDLSGRVFGLRWRGMCCVLEQDTLSSA